MDLVKDIFNDKDQQLILSLPFSSRRCDDVWLWLDDVKGFYSVKSGYKLSMRNHVSTSDPSDVKWDLIWKLNIPTKVRNFIWRVLSKCLPTRQALRKRKV